MKHISILSKCLLALTFIMTACNGGGGSSSSTANTSPTNTPTSNTPAATNPITTALPASGIYGSPQSITLTADRAATIYYSLDGNLPSIGGANTISGSSPISNIQVSNDTNLLQFFAVGSSGNQEPVKSEMYIVNNGTATGPGDPQNCYSLTLGNTWITKVTVTETGAPTVTYSDTMSITGTKTVNGVTAIISKESNPDNTGVAVEEYVLKSSNGLVFIGSNDTTDAITPQMVPYQVMNFPYETSGTFESVNKTNLDYGQDLDHDGKNEILDVNYVTTAKSFESVAVPVGTFNDCLRLETKGTATVTLSGDNQKITVMSTETRWLAPGVGPVKYTSVTTQSNDSSYSKTEMEELTGFYVDGQGKGIMPQFTVASDVATPNSDTETPGKSAIGFDGTNYLFVSSHTVGSSLALYGVIISGAGTGKILNTFQIVQLSQGSQFPRPSVAFDGSNYLVVFSQSGQIFGIRISPSGNALDGPNGFAISSSTSNWAPVVAFDGTNYLVAWGKFSSDYNIYGARVTTGGQILDEFPIFQASGEQVEPAIAFDSNNYMIVWRDTRSGSGPSNGTDIYGTRVTKDGTVLDPTGIPVSTAPGYQGEPNIVFDGTNYFVVWSDQRNSLSYMHNDIYGTRMSPDGTLLDGPSATGGIAIYTGTNNSEYPSAIFDGTNYVVVSSVSTYSIYPPVGIFAARVSANGSLIDGPSTGTGISISGLPPANSKFVYPAILFNGKNSLLTWVNNSEQSGVPKDVRGVLIYP